MAEDRAYPIIQDDDYNGPYSLEDRVNAAMLYAVKGTLKAVSRETGIPDTTLLEWKQKGKEFWVSTIERVRAENHNLAISRYTEIVDKATRETLDRLEHGDVAVGKDGERYTVPVKARDAATIAAIATDKTRLLNNQPTSISGRQGMDDLAKQFKELAASYQARDVNVVSDQTQARESDAKD